MRLAGVGGIGVVALVWCSALSQWGPDMFMDLTTMVLLGVTVAGLGLASFGAGDFLHALKSLPAAFVHVPQSQVAPRDTVVLRGMVRHVYAAAALATVTGAIIILSDLASAPETIAAGCAVDLLPILYSIAAAEFIIRPAISGLDSLLAEAARR